MNAFGNIPVTTRAAVFSEPHTLTDTPQDCVSAVRFAPPNSPVPLLGVTAWDGSCSIWQLAGGPNNAIQSRPLMRTMHDLPLLDLSFSANGRVFYGGCGRTVEMWDLNSNSKTVVASHDLPVSCLSHVHVTNNGNELLVTGSWDGKIRWWDLRQPQCVKEDIIGEPIFDVDMQRSYPMLAAVSGRAIHVYDLQSMQKVRTMRPPDVMKFNLRCVACSPTLEGLVVGGSEGRVSFMSMKALPSSTYKNHISVDQRQSLLRQTNFCAHHPTLPLLISGGGDGCIVVVDRENKRVLTRVSATQKFEEQPISISAGDVNADATLVAYAHSYDWAMGLAFYRNQPTSIHLRTLAITGP